MKETAFKRFPGVAPLVWAVLPEVDAPPLSAREIHKMIDCYAFGAVQNVLHQLRRDGAVVSDLRTVRDAIQKRVYAKA